MSRCLIPDELRAASSPRAVSVWASRGTHSASRACLGYWGPELAHGGRISAFHFYTSFTGID